MPARPPLGLHGSLRGVPHDGCVPGRDPLDVGEEPVRSTGARRQEREEAPDAHAGYGAREEDLHQGRRWWAAFHCANGRQQDLFLGAQQLWAAGHGEGGRGDHSSRHRIFDAPERRVPHCMRILPFCRAPQERATVCVGKERLWAAWAWSLHALAHPRARDLPEEVPGPASLMRVRPRHRLRSGGHGARRPPPGEGVHVGEGGGGPAGAQRHVFSVRAEGCRDSRGEGREGSERGGVLLGSHR
mmetsp:Transcript_35976/g.86897  ORF Transcript_35976/g.86897 Transcript_35976/m.86897 type:complete len:243 (+) Transcript_35976:3600-4328(+)